MTEPPDGDGTLSAVVPTITGATSEPAGATGDAAPANDAPSAPSAPSAATPATRRDHDARARRPAAVAAQPFPIVPKETYEILGEHARGGLGRVLLARDLRLNRTVALKLLAAEGARALRRFQREALLTARLQHPAIVPVHEAGYFDNGEPFYAMKLVEGRPFRDLIKERAALADRLTLLPNVLVVAEAMAYAHGQRVIHRDLKPSNVLIGDYGETVVIDWGLAKDLNLDADDEPVDISPYRAAAAPGLTVTGAVLGTPAYMPPEQAEGRRVDERADVYALGAMLYHLLAGAPPYKGTSSDEIITSLRQGAPPALELRAPAAPRELVAIVAKAMAPDPADRYDDARAFATDLARFQSGQLVGAHQYRRTQLFGRWLARHKLALAVVTSVAIAGVTIGAVAVARVVAERDRAERQRREAVSARAAAEQQKNEMVFTQAESALERDPTQTVQLLQQYQLSEGNLRKVKLLAADAVSRGVASRVLRLHDGQVDEVFVSRGGRWLFSRGSIDGVKVTAVDSGDVFVDAVKRAPFAVLAYSRQQDLAVFSDGADSLIAFDAASGRALEPAQIQGGIAQVEFVPDGKRLMVVRRSDRQLLTCQLAPIRCADTGHSVAGGVPSPDLTINERWLALAAPSESPSAIDLTSDRELRSTAPPGTAMIIVAARGADAPLGLTLADAQTRIELLPPAPSRPGFDVPAALTMANLEQPTWVFGFMDGRVVVADGPAFAAILKARCGKDEIGAVGASSDGALVVAGSKAGPICAWNRATGEKVSLTTPYPVTSVDVADDGLRFVSGNDHGEVRFWIVPSRSRVFDVGSKSPVAAARSKAGWMLVGTDRGEINIYGPGAVRPEVAQAHRAQVTSIAVDESGRAFVSGSVDGEVRVGALPDGGSREVMRFGGAVVSVGFGPGTDDVVGAGSDKTVRVWSPERGTETLLGEVDSTPMALAIDRTRGRLAVGLRSGGIMVWTAGASTPLRLDGHRAMVRALAWSPDGSRLASVSADGSLRVTVPEPASQCSFSFENDSPTDVAFSPDGTSIYLGTMRGTVGRILPDCTGFASLRRAGSMIMELAVAPDVVAWGTQAGVVEVLNPSGGEAAVLRGHEAAIAVLLVGAPGEDTVTTSWDGTMRRWFAGYARPPVATQAQFEDGLRRQVVVK
jgi:WD40 repeat protein